MTYDYVCVHIGASITPFCPIGEKQRAAVWCYDVGPRRPTSKEVLVGVRHGEATSPY